MYATTGGRLRERLRGMPYDLQRMIRRKFMEELADLYRGGPLLLDLADLVRGRMPPLWASDDAWRKALADIDAEVLGATGGHPLAVKLLDLVHDRLSICRGQQDRERALRDLKAELLELSQPDMPFADGWRKQYAPAATKTAYCSLEKKTSGGADFSMYALAFNNIDREGDIALPGCVTNTAELVGDGWAGINHMNSALPVGYFISAVQDAKGLLVRGKFHSTADAQACRAVVAERLAAGKGCPCSVGYLVDDAGYATVDGRQVRLLKSIRVYECSFVNLGANQLAGVVSAG